MLTMSDLRKGTRRISGEVERIGTVCGTDSGSYVFRIKNDSAVYYVSGSRLSVGEVQKFGGTLALTAPGDKVSFVFHDKQSRVISFENESYPETEIKGYG